MKREEGPVQNLEEPQGWLWTKMILWELLLSISANKLSAYGFDSISLQWFHDYLLDHKQHGVLDNTYSDWGVVLLPVINNLK